MKRRKEKRGRKSELSLRAPRMLKKIQVDIFLQVYCVRKILEWVLRRDTSMVLD